MSSTGKLTAHTSVPCVALAQRMLQRFRFVLYGTETGEKGFCERGAAQKEVEGVTEGDWRLWGLPRLVPRLRLRPAGLSARTGRAIHWWDGQSLSSLSAQSEGTLPPTAAASAPILMIVITPVLAVPSVSYARHVSTKHQLPSAIRVQAAEYACPASRCKLGQQHSTDLGLVHREIKYKKPSFQHNLYQECGVFYLIPQCRLSGACQWAPLLSSNCTRRKL
eukprot:2180873-Rhodomonas_salina.2